jgi:hypothetical protein
MQKSFRFYERDPSELVEFCEKKLFEHSILHTFFQRYDGVTIGPPFDPAEHGLRGKKGREARDALGWAYLPKASAIRDGLRLTVRPPNGVDFQRALAQLAAAGVVGPPVEEKWGRARFLFPSGTEAETVISFTLAALRALCPHPPNGEWEFRPDKHVDQ